MFDFVSIKNKPLNLNTPRVFEESDYAYLADLFAVENPLESLFFLDCSEETSEENYVLYLFIEDNGDLVAEDSDFQLFDLDEKKIVLYNSFEERYIFCLKKDIGELSESL